MRTTHTLVVVSLVGALAAVGPAAAGNASPAAPTTVKVNMTDYAFALSKRRVAKGTVVFRVVNSGEVVHDFRIAGKKTPIYSTGRSGVLRVLFKQPGNYAFVCTVPGHVAAGMKGVLQVTG